jgi:penicillin-binding protein 2
VLSILIVVGVLAALVSIPLRNLLSTSNVPLIGGCASGSSCQAATAFLADYGSGDYESMYNRVSSASRAQFNNASIRGGYKDAHDYIVNRTKAILVEAQVTSIQTTVGDTKSQSDTRSTVNAQVTLASTSVGPITQSLAIPLTKENGQWMVDWTPGLIFAQLDDSNDPNYQRLVHLVATTGARGTIIDRNGNVLAKDDTVYDVDVDPSQIRNETSLDAALATDLNMTPDQVKAAYKAGRPVRTITQDYYAKISGSLNSLPAVYTQQRTGRIYPYGADLAPVTGYVSGVTPDDLKNDADHYYCQLDDATTCTASDVAGHTGIEAWAEKYLRPQKGGTLAVVDRNADGSPSSQPVVTIASRQAVNGADVHTTIALKDQQAAMGMLRLYQQYGGGAFAVDPASGDVLVMASYAPLQSAQFHECNPNDFSLGFTPATQACLGTQGAQLNRALQSAQPIGSMFKIVTLSAYLQSGGSPAQQWDCRGSYLVPGQQTPLTDSDTNKPAKATAPGAIGPSCDTTYWEIGVYLNSSDPNLIPNSAKQFGYGSPVSVVGVPDGVENPGLVPDPQWVKTNKNATWAPIDAANLAVGQGFFLATPAQVALVAAGIANNGVRMQPRLVSSIQGTDGSPIASFAPKPLGTIPLSPQNLAIVQQAMLGPTSPGGTAYSSFQHFPMPVAGKTGTAETPQPDPMSWFMSYAPVPPQTSTIATAALIENSTFGEYCAVPMTMQILRAQFNLTGDPDPNLVHLCQIHASFS